MLRASAKHARAYPNAFPSIVETPLPARPDARLPLKQDRRNAALEILCAGSKHRLVSGLNKGKFSQKNNGLATDGTRVEPGREGIQIQHGKARRWEG